MKNKIFKLILCLTIVFTIFLSNQCFSQTVIDYSTLPNEYAQNCNAFSILSASSGVPIACTENGANSYVFHNTVLGQPRFNAITKTIDMTTEVISNVPKGNQYGIVVNFKAGHSYKITITAARIMTQQNGPNVLLNTDLTDLNLAGLGIIACNGLGTIINPTTSTNPFSQSLQVVNSSFATPDANYIFNYSNLTLPMKNLLIASIAPAGSVKQTTLIRKIVIEETLPDASFTLSPLNLSIEKGTSATQIFTINNLNNTNGVTGYSWNIGATPNGWLYAGTPAPQFITTTSNNLTLSSVACANTVNSINALAKIGTTLNYETNTSAVSLSNPTFTVTGPSQLCTTAAQTYNLSPNNCNYNVIWSVSNPLVSYTPGLNSVSVSSNALVSGSFNLIATLAGAGGNVVITKPISVGPPALSNGVITTYNVLKCNVRGYKYTVPAIGATNYRWFSSNITQGTPFVQFKNSADNWATRGGDESCDITEIKLEISNSCNTSTPEIIYIPSDLCPPYLDGSCTYGRGIEVTSNTNQTTIQIKLIDEPNVKPALTQPRKIQKIRIVNKMGQAKKILAGNKLEAMTLDISDLPMDVYTIMVSDGKKWMSVQIAKK